MDTQGTWYVAYAAPDPFHVTPAKAIYCFKEIIIIDVNNTKSVTITSDINILNKNVTHTQKATITSTNSIWAVDNQDFAWIDFDADTVNYGIIASMKVNTFFVLSRIPNIPQDLLNKALSAAQSQGYTTTGVAPANSHCTPFGDEE